MSLILYEHSTSICAVKVRLTLLEKGIDYEGRLKMGLVWCSGLDRTEPDLGATYGARVRSPQTKVESDS